MSVTYFKQMIREAIGERNFEIYFNTLQDWFNDMITKDFYDIQMEVLLSEGSAFSLHNEMIKLILRNVSKGITDFNLDDDYNELSQLQDIKIEIAARNKVLDQNNKKHQQKLELENDDQDQVSVVSSSSSSSSLSSKSKISSSSSVDCTDESSESPFENNLIQLKKQDMYILPLKTLKKEELSNHHSHSILQEKNDSSILHLVNHDDWMIKNTLSQDTRIENLTHSFNMEDIPSELQTYLKPLGLNRVFSSNKLSLQGKFYLKALELGLKSVTQGAFDIAINECKNRARNLVTAIIKQRKAFHIIKDEETGQRKAHFMNENYPNPYLRKSWSFYKGLSKDREFLINKKSAKFNSISVEEKERLAALQKAVNVPENTNCRYRKANLNDLYNTIQTNKNLIPNNTARLKFIIQINKRKGNDDKESTFSSLIRNTSNKRKLDADCSSSDLSDSDQDSSDLSILDDDNEIDYVPACVY